MGLFEAGVESTVGLAPFFPLTVAVFLFFCRHFSV